MIDYLYEIGNAFFFTVEPLGGQVVYFFNHFLNLLLWKFVEEVYHFVFLVNFENGWNQFDQTFESLHPGANVFLIDNENEPDWIGACEYTHGCQAICGIHKCAFAVIEARSVS